MAQILRVRCKYDTMMSIEDLQKRVNPDNNNRHNPEQVEQLAEIFEYQGIRKPIYLNRASGLIQSGHGRLMSAVHNKYKEFPVEWQEYDDEEQAYADLTADNAVARQAALDLSGVRKKVSTLGRDFKLQLLGIKGLTGRPGVIEPPKLPEAGSKESEQMTFTLHSSQADLLRQALKLAKEKHKDRISTDQNSNSNGNAIAYICEVFLLNG